MDERRGNKMRKGHPFLTVKPDGKKEFLKLLSSVKFLDGYASNISRYMNVEERVFPIFLSLKPMSIK